MKTKEKSSERESQSPSISRLLDRHQHGEVTDLEVVLTLLSIVDRAVMQDAVAALTPSLRSRLEDFVRQYEPDAPVFKGPKPNTQTVQLVKELLASRSLDAGRSPAGKVPMKKRKRRKAG